MNHAHASSLILALTFLSASCTTQTPRPSPTAGATVRADNREFFVIPCRGAKSAGVRCPSQWPVATWFRGGLVCQRGDGEVREAAVESVPPSVCEGLFGGCEPARAAPAPEVIPALDDEARSAIATAGFRAVQCSANAVRLDAIAAAEHSSSVPPSESDNAGSAESAGTSSTDRAQSAEPAEPAEDPHLVARTEELRVALVREGVAQSTGVGQCCSAPGESLSPRALCVRIELPSGGPRPTAIAERFQAIARETRHPLRLSIETRPRVPPRCTADDPDCAPTTGDGLCPDLLGIRHGAARTPISSALNAGVDLRAYEHGRCQHDGDCAVGGCGQHCAAVGTHGFASTCEGVPALESAACGCVRGRCRWFVAASN
jgi:hypothetical protein